MKKIKIISLILVLGLLFNGCASMANSSDITSADITSTEEDTSYADTSSEEIEEIEENLNTFSCNAKQAFDSMRLIANLLTDIVVLRDGDYKFYYSKIESNNLEVLLFIDDPDNNFKALSVWFREKVYDSLVSDFHKALVAPLKEMLNNDNYTDAEILSFLEASKNGQKQMFNNITIEHVKAEGGYQIKIFPTENDYPIENLPVIAMKRHSPFLSNKEKREQLKKVLNEYDYALAQQMCEEYLESAEKEDEVVSQILELLIQEDFQESLTKCYIVSDPVENEANLYYKDADTINRKTNVIAFMDNGKLKYRVGFISNSWVFFTRISINTGDERNVVKSWSYSEVTRDVIRGGVKEYGTPSFREEDINKIINAENPIMRFADSNQDKSLDHTITKQEQDGLRTMYIIGEVHNEILEIVSDYKKEFC